MYKKLKIAILTTARSDFGLLRRVIQHASSMFTVDLLVAGSHFLRSRGETAREIEQEISHLAGVTLVPFNTMSEECSAVSQVQTLAATQLQVSRWFAGNRCDLLLFLGDRWELWGVTLPAFLHGIPMAHISGGEVTEGVIDDSVRHAHTKIAGLHFAATEAYARNISLMGEEDWRISVVGECGLDLIHDMDMAGTGEIRSAFAVDLEKETILVTFHPSTLEFGMSIEEQIGSILNALARYSAFQIIFTAPGVEQGAETILAALRKFVTENPNAVLVDHFGSRNYLSVMSRSKVVLGNSSSGLVEAPSLGIPSINVGNRQKNRLSAESVQHVACDENEIAAAIARAVSNDYQDYARTCRNPYDPFGDGQNSLRIVNALKCALTECSREQLLLKKFDNEVSPEEWNRFLKGE